MHRPQVEAVDEGDRISIENSKPEVSVKLEENDMDDDIGKFCCCVELFLKFENSVF